MKFLNKGLKDTQWAGRNQIINKEQLTYYIDGAHTPESMQVYFDKLIRYSIYVCSIRV